MIAKVARLVYGLKIAHTAANYTLTVGGNVFRSQSAKNAVQNTALVGGTIALSAVGAVKAVTSAICVATAMENVAFTAVFGQTGKTVKTVATFVQNTEKIASSAMKSSVLALCLIYLRLT